MPFWKNENRNGTGNMEVGLISNFPKKVKIVEVGPRDGLQYESTILDPEDIIEFINRLSRSGLTHIETGSFVNPKLVPQMANSEFVFSGIDRPANVIFSALVPNIEGMQRALDVDVTEIAIFTSSSETFCQKNIRCSVQESLQRFEPVIKLAQENNVPVRAYLSCVMGCPYEGPIKLKKVATLAGTLLKMGCYEISLGDTIGVGTANYAIAMIKEVLKHVPLDRIAVHFHDTRGQALANIFACLDLGIKNIDASVAGLGGCPFAKGASGNVATEDVLYMLNQLGITTNVDLNTIIETGKFISEKLDRENLSKVSNAGIPDWIT